MRRLLSKATELVAETISVTPSSSVTQAPVALNSSLQSLGNSGPAVGPQQVAPESNLSSGSPHAFITSLKLPIGVVTEPSGSLWVNYLYNPDAFTFASALNRHSTTGAFQNGVIIDSSATAAPNHITRLASGAHLGLASGDIIVAEPDGDLFIYRASSNLGGLLLDMQTLPINSSQIVDARTGQISNFGGTIQPNTASYGDIAIYETGSKADIFMGGKSNGLPFVLRIRVQSASVVDARVIMASTNVTASSGVEPGIAVNADGTVLTALNYHANSGTAGPQVPVVFSSTFPETDPNYTIFPGVPMPTRGMTTDGLQNFLIAAGDAGGGTSSVYHSIDRFVTTINSFVTNVPFAPTSRDVAVAPGNDFAYVSFAGDPAVGFDEIWRLPYVPPGGNQPPVITSLSDSPDPVTLGNVVTLTANGVSDSDGTVSSVSFYRESNGTAGLQIGGGGDTLVGTDNSSAGGWTVGASTSGLTAGNTYTYYAIATDDGGASSNVVSSTNTIAGAPGSLAGVLWRDLNSDGVRDSGEPFLSGRTVYLDQNQNGQRDGGEAFTTTNASGAYSFTGLTPGTYHVRQELPSGWIQTTPTTPPPGAFQIDVTFIDDTLTPSQKAAFQTAANRWAQIITADLPDVIASDGFPVDDLRIDASAPLIDGPGGILGQAGPTEIRIGSNLPARGIMEFDQADLADLEADGQLVETIIHEMGHVLGLGALWSLFGLVTGAGTSNPQYTGVNARAEYNAIFANAAASIPVENTGGAGTRDVHWRETVFGTELMTGFLNAGVVNPLSRISAAGLIDLGYPGVVLSAADAYSPPAGGAAAESAVIGQLRTLDRPLKFVEPITKGASNESVGPPAAHTVTLSSGQNVTGRDFGSFPTVFTGGSGNDTYVLRVDPSNSARRQVIESIGGGANVTYSAPATLVASMQWDFQPGSGNDTLTIDLTNGNPIGSSGVNFNGGTHVTGDALILTGTAGADVVTVTPTTVTFGGTINYSSVETITANTGNGDDVMNFSGSAAAVTFNGGNSTVADVLNVSAGTFTFAADANVGTTKLNVNVTSAAGNVVFNARQHLNGLSIVGGSATVAQNGNRTLVTQTLAVSGGGRLDLKDNDLIVRGGTLGSWNGLAYTGITGLVQSGRNEGTWDGVGIRTSMTDALSDFTTLGVARASDALGIGAAETEVWSGETVNGSAILVKYTYSGDANLDGMLNIDDYGQIDFNVGLSGVVFGFFNGDFNLDGLINIDDYGVIDFNVGIQGPPL